jgi:hypothetical protein|tara:strand:- start:942 stop:1232 length:291 start_codon:yes stop_codon:yes gene_type:complete
MADYSKTTNFGAKDTLPSGNSGKIISGGEFDTEFNALQTAIATKADLISPALTGSATAQTLGVSVALNSTGATTLSGTTTLAGTLAGTFTIDGGTF